MKLKFKKPSKPVFSKSNQKLVKTTVNKPKPPAKPEPTGDMADAGDDIKALVAYAEAHDEAAAELEGAKEGLSEHLQMMLETYGKGPYDLGDYRAVIVFRRGGYFLRKVKG